MALVKNLEKISMERKAEHSEVNCTYSIIEEVGEKYLQIDTYGSTSRKIKGKKSQSIRFSFDAIKQLKTIIEKEFA